MRRTTRRVARKPRPCGMTGRRSYCRLINPGEVYLEHVISPGDSDVGNVTWWRSSECSDCATRCGRGHLLAEPSQPCRS